MPDFKTVYSPAFVQVVRDGTDFYYLPVRAKVDCEDWRVRANPHTVRILNEDAHPFFYGFENVQDAQTVVDRYNDGPNCGCIESRWNPIGGHWEELEFEESNCGDFYDSERVAERRATGS